MASKASKNTKNIKSDESSLAAAETLSLNSVKIEPPKSKKRQVKGKRKFKFSLISLPLFIDITKDQTEV